LFESQSRKCEMLNILSDQLFKRFLEFVKTETRLDGIDVYMSPYIEKEHKRYYRNLLRSK